MIKLLMLGGTGVIGQSILSVIGNDSSYSITVTSRVKRRSEYENVHYLCGDANDINFINTFENNSYDVLIDFMNYRNEVLESNFSKVIKIAKQYIFLSSARVYDNSQMIIDETCPLLLHTTEDIAFKKSGTYAVKKAYQEEYVKENGGNGVTIIRPYKTYSDERLQLGEYEIKHWLKRLFNNKPIVLNEKILSKYTSLTYGVDVAKGIIELIGNEKAYGETFQLVTNEYMTWNEVLSIYVGELKKRGITPIIYLSEDTHVIDNLFENGYQMPYDIMFDRRFNSAKMLSIKNIAFKSIREGLIKAITQYCNNNTFDVYEPTEYDLLIDEFIKNNNLNIWKEK